MPHPSERLSKEWISIIRNDSSTAEKMGSITTKQLALLRQEKWFLALVPKVYGGLEWSLPEIVAFEESIGWADGSFGWVFTLCSGAGWFGGFLDMDLAKSIFALPTTCLAGSGASTGTADLQDDGSYILNGEWRYASGAPQASVYTVNCVLTKDGEPILLNEKQRIVSFCLMPDEINITHKWSKIGLIASASHSFKVDNISIPNERTFIIDPAFTNIKTTLYRFPFLQLAEATLAANISGMAYHFVDEWKGLMQSKKDRNGQLKFYDEKMQETFHTLYQEYRKWRYELFDSTELAWELISYKQNAEEALAKITEASHKLVHSARNLVNGLYPYCGLSVVDNDTEISRVWKDFQTGSQHALFCS